MRVGVLARSWRRFTASRVLVAKPLRRLLCVCVDVCVGMDAHGICVPVLCVYLSTWILYIFVCVCVCVCVCVL